MIEGEQLLSVAILNWNGEQLLKQFLPSVVQYSKEDYLEIVVIDNASSDYSVEFVQKEYPQIKLIQLDRNYGFAEGYNRGIEQLSTPYVCLLNSDVSVSENWLLAPLTLLKGNPQIFAVQPKIRSYKHPQYFEYAGAGGGFVDCFGYPYCRGRIFDTIEEDKGQYEQEIPIFWASGAALFVRRDKYLEVGGLDNKFFAHMEEIDLAWRLHKKGGEIIYTPNSIVYHVGGASLESGSPKKVYLNFRNNLLMLYKNLPRKKFWKIYCIRFFMDLLSAFVFLLQGKPSLMKAVLKAQKDFFHYKKQYTRPLDKENDFSYYPLGKYSIVWQYFVRGRKHFTDLPSR